MFSGFPLFPEQGSSVAADVDNLYFFLLAITAFFSTLIAGLVIYFAIRYRRRSEVELPEPITGSTKLETLWTVIPAIIVMVIFAWGAKVFLSLHRPPSDATPIYVVGKQWMWKLQHLEGQREINELHVPVGRSVKMIMSSEDVIHSFYIPAFRVKADVLPGRYTSIWFKATKPGEYHLFCAEYCGTKHSGMIGWVTVMTPADYQTWLSGGTGEESLAMRGQKAFMSLACNSCHRSDGSGRGPVLDGLFGRVVELEGGQKIVADENYIRESILNPKAKIVAGYQPVMPTFQGLVGEEQLLQLVTYIKSLTPVQSGAPAGATPPANPPRVEAPAQQPTRNPR